MKKFIATLIASSIAATPVMAQQFQNAVTGQIIGQTSTNCVNEIDRNTGRALPVTNNQRFEMTREGQIAQFTHAGQVFYRLIDCSAMGPAVQTAAPTFAAPVAYTAPMYGAVPAGTVASAGALGAGSSAAGLATAGAAAAAPAAAAAAGFGGLGVAGALIGAVVLVAAIAGGGSSTPAHH